MDNSHGAASQPPPGESSGQASKKRACLPDDEGERSTWKHAKMTDRSARRTSSVTTLASRLSISVQSDPSMPTAAQTAPTLKPAPGPPEGNPSSGKKPTVRPFRKGKQACESFEKATTELTSWDDSADPAEQWARVGRVLNHCMLHSTHINAMDPESLAAVPSEIWALTSHLHEGLRWSEDSERLKASVRKQNKRVHEILPKQIWKP